MLQTLTAAALIVPLAIDTFVLGTALGAAGLERRERLRASLLLTAFEAGMPLVGFLAGAGLGRIIGRLADYFAVVVLAAIGAWMLRPGGSDDEDEKRGVRLLESARGWAILVLGFSISLDELAIGFSVGLLRLPVPLLIALIAIQAFAAAQLGMRLGSRLAQSAKERAEKVAGVLLLLAAALVLLEKLTGA